ncbi:MAG TPA: DNA/RNA helicase domain-containing protein [Longimicrobium sp.]|jgi:hypothetical protein
MHLAKLKVEDFIRSAPALWSTLAEQYRLVHRRSPGESEVDSWRHSLPHLARVLAAAAPGTREGTIYLEYEMPSSSARADALVVGLGRDQRRAGVVVELKQWDARSILVEGTLVRVGPAWHSHPSDQALGYRDFLADLSEAFADQPHVLGCCSFLHNLPAQGALALTREPFARLCQLSPVFTGDRVREMADWISGIVAERPDSRFLADLDADRVRVSRSLFQNVAKAVREEPAWHLLESQRTAYGRILDLALRDDGEKHLVLVTGGPGTGKSVIAMQLMGQLSRRAVPVVHVTNSKSFTTVMQSLISVRGSRMWGSQATEGLFRLSHSWVRRKDAFDVALCDEAHRFRRSTNLRPYLVSGRPQAEEIMERVRTTVAFIDERQILRKAEQGTVDYFRRCAEAVGIRPENIHGPIELQAQFRQAGSSEFLGALDSALYEERPVGFAHRNFAVDVVASVAELEEVLRAKVEAGYSARLLAGFCWPWSDPGAGGSLAHDVRIGGWSRPWNAKAVPSKHYTPDQHPYTLWATRRHDQLGEIGCIYSAQGFEFDHIGLIWGPDLVWRGGRWVARPERSSDSEMRSGAGRVTSPAVALPLLKNAYRVLATRGMRGCWIHCEDEQTAEYLRGALTAGG